MKKTPARKPTKFQSFLKEFRIEVIALLAAGLGIFLLVARFEILKTIYAWGRSVLRWLGQSIIGLIDRIIEHFTTHTLSDLTGLVLILLSISFIFWRVRVRLLKRLHWRERACPRCNHEVHRIHRKWLDRVWGFLLMRPLHRYYCSNPACGWTGLRYGAHLHQDNEKPVTQSPSL